MAKELDSPAIAEARKKNSQGFTKEEALALQTLLLVPPEHQLLRDVERLRLLEQEKFEGKKPFTEVNISKNPRKELWRQGTISDEIARTNLTLEDLLTRIDPKLKKPIPELTATPKATKKQEAPSTLEALTDAFYSKLLQLLKPNSGESK